MNISTFLSVFSFFIGVSIGSFLNAVIYRMPREIPIGLPRSRCPSCAKVIFWYENIPIISWFLLRGKCSGCGMRISCRYPIVELVTGLFAFFMAPSSFAPSEVLVFTYQLTLFGILLAIFLIDFDFQIIPNSLNIYLAIILFVFNSTSLPWKKMIVGAGIGFLLPFLVTWGFYQLKGKIGLGGGDIKLYTALGIALQPFGIVQNIFLSCFLGAIVGISLIGFKVIDKNTPIPFGPFIVIVASLQFFIPGSFSRFWSLMFFYLPL